MIIVSRLFYPNSFFFYFVFVFVFLRVTDQDQSIRQSKTHIFGIITSIDLLDYIMKNNPAANHENRK